MMIMSSSNIIILITEHPGHIKWIHRRIIIINAIIAFNALNRPYLSIFSSGCGE